MNKPTLAIHKFSSCDGCQLAILNLGETLLELPKYVDIVHFIEAGPNNPDAQVDIALVEGSISTPEDIERIKKIRENTQYLIAIGACATSGGIQALRNLADTKDWVSAIYMRPDYISILEKSLSIQEVVKTDFELHGCPVNSTQVVTALRSLLSGAKPVREKQNVCVSCKQMGIPCVMVTKNESCMGPVTQAGCNALCPSVGRSCYGCYGRVDKIDINPLIELFKHKGKSKTEINRKFNFIVSNKD